MLTTPPLLPSSLPPLPAPVVRAAVAAQSRFAAAFIGRDGGGGGVAEWVHTFYRRPRPDLAIGALTTALATPGALAGAAAFPAVAFLAHVVPRICRDAASAEALLRYGADVARHSCGASDAAEKVDTLVRAVSWSRAVAPHGAVVAGVFADAWRSRLQRGAPRRDDADDVAEAWDVADSIAPPAGSDAAAVVAAGPVALLHVPVPSLDIGSLQRHVTRQLHWSFTGGSRHLFRYVRAVHRLARVDSSGSGSGGSDERGADGGRRDGGRRDGGGRDGGGGGALDVAVVTPPSNRVRCTLALCLVCSTPLFSSSVACRPAAQWLPLRPDGHAIPLLLPGACTGDR